jgi:predicted acylesterase/phospholipase RssA
MKPSEMIKSVLAIKRADIWDMGGSFGLLKGQLFQALIERDLPVQTFSECRCPLGVTTFDLAKCKTQYITEGHLATAMRASCTFPGMFQPVYIGGSPNIDGGVFDGVGLLALPHAMGLAKNFTVCDAPVRGEEGVAGVVEVRTGIETNSAGSIRPATSTAADADADTNGSARASKRHKRDTTTAATVSSADNTKNNATTSASASVSAAASRMSVVPLQSATQHLVVNVVFGKASLSSSVLPPELTNHKVRMSLLFSADRSLSTVFPQHLA